jgi:GAF domain
LRAATWLLHMALPLLALWLLLAQPEFDLAWDDRVGHLVLVLSTALVSVALGGLIGRAARARDDARLWLVALVFVITAGFFGLHALVTPGVLVETSEADFMLPTRVGLVLAGVVALASSVEFNPGRIARLRSLRRPLTVLVYALMAACAVVILLRVLDRLLDPALADGAARVAALVGSVLFTSAALSYLPIYRRRPAVVVMSVLTAFVLLAEASLALAFAPSWHASWWLWHVLMTLAFCFIAYSAHIQFHRQGSARGLFDSLATQQTIAELRRDYAAALEAMVDVLQLRERGEEVPLGAVTAGLAARFDLTEQQVAVLKRGAEALGAEREQVRKLGGLVAVGREASVVQDEDVLLERVAAAAVEAFPRDQLRLGLIRDGELGFADGAAGQLAQQVTATLQPATDARTLALPLMVKGRAAGVIEARRPHGRFADADVALLRSFASQASIALENARLYHHLDGLFRSYMSPAVATALLADPEQAGAGWRDRRGDGADGRPARLHRVRRSHLSRPGRGHAQHLLRRGRSGHPRCGRHCRAVRR